MRRPFLSRLLLLPSLGGQATAGPSPAKDKILIKSAWGSATFANPAIFVSLVEWADKVLTE